MIIGFSHLVARYPNPEWQIAQLEELGWYVDFKDTVEISLEEKLLGAHPLEVHQQISMLRHPAGWPSIELISDTNLNASHLCPYTAVISQLLLNEQSLLNPLTPPSSNYAPPGIPPHLKKNKGTPHLQINTSSVHDLSDTFQQVLGFKPSATTSNSQRLTLKGLLPAWSLTVDLVETSSPNTSRSPFNTLGCFGASFISSDIYRDLKQLKNTVNRTSSVFRLEVNKKKLLVSLGISSPGFLIELIEIK